MKQTLFILFLTGISCTSIFSQNNDIFLYKGDNTSIVLQDRIKKAAVSDPNIAGLNTISDNEILINGRQEGETALVIWLRKEKIIRKLIVAAFDPEAVKQEITYILKNIRGINISIQEGKIVLTGEVNDQQNISVLEDVIKKYKNRIINLIRLPVQMIKINARIVEISESVDSSIGIDWRKKFMFAEDTINGITSIGKMTRQTKLDAMLDFLVKDGRAKIVARPNIIVRNGQKANFHAGGKVLIPLISENKLSVDEKSYGVDMSILPTGDRKSNLIKTKVQMEVSTLDWKNGVKYNEGTIPAVRDRKIDTEIDIKLGKTIVIAGLLMEEENEVSNKVPILGYIPLLNYLFSSTETITSKTELVVFLTPSFVNFLGEEIIE